MSVFYFSFKANEREKTGRFSNIELRKKLNVPGVIYFNNYSNSIYISKFDIDTLIKRMSNGVKLFECDFKNEKFLVIVKDIHYHPYKNEYMNIDFQRVSLDSYVSLDVSFKFIGIENSIGLKNGGILIKHMTSIFVKGLISNIPENIIVDVSKLNLNESLYLSDFIFNDKYTVPSFYIKSKFLVVSIVGSRVLDDKTSKDKLSKDKLSKDKDDSKEKSQVKSKDSVSVKEKKK